MSESIAAVLQGARADGRDLLLDPEGLAVLRAMDIAVPHQLFVRTSHEIDPAAIMSFPGERLVVKIVAPHARHKTAIGGVMIVPRDPAAAVAAIDQMERRFVRQPVAGYTVNEYIPHDQSLGSQILLGMRWTDEFGPVVTLALGGVDAEFLAGHLAVGSGTVSLSPTLHARDGLAAVLSEKTSFLRDLRVTGWRLGALSNAGFECVAIADNAGSFQLESLNPETTRRLEDIFRSCRIDTIVEVHNPVDLTPIMDDETFEEAIRIVLEADNIDVGIIGCVPLTGALNTLVGAAEHRENVFDERSIATRMARLKTIIRKPWVAVVDAGSLYDPMASLLDGHEVPTFRTSDRALRVFRKYCQYMIESMGSQTTVAAKPGH